ncbi:MAG: response regulator [Bacteroidetes bacterium]|nr:response regulator [Bacteroidota bacterium]
MTNLTQNTDKSLLGLIRMLLFSKLAIVFLALFIAFYFGLRSIHQLIRSIEVITEPDSTLSLIEDGISNLYQADNNFRDYILTRDSKTYYSYTSNLTRISEILGCLRNSVNRNTFYNLNHELIKKEKISRKYIRLKEISDSLLSLAVSFDSVHIESFDLPRYDIRKFSVLHHKLQVDSVTQAGKSGKIGFLKKVKNLFIDETGKEPSKTIIRRSESKIDSTYNTEINPEEKYLLNDIQSYYNTNLKKYSDGRNRLNKRESELVEVNSKLIVMMKSILESTHNETLQAISKLKHDAYISSRKSTRYLIIIAAFVFLIASILFVMIAINLRKFRNFTIGLQVAKEGSDQLALQKSNFLASMSHEIRAPLNNIIGFTEQLNNEKLTADQKNSLHGISSSSELLLSTVNQILDFSTLETGKMRFQSINFNPYKVINEVVLINELRASQKRLVLKNLFRVDEQAIVTGDAYRLKQVIQNLVDNAIKYSDGGEITIQTNIESTGSKTCLLKVQVADHGIGIPEDQLGNVFIEFNRIEEDGKRPWQAGTGLGLPICKRIIEQQHGKIELMSIPGEGSIFSFEIPYSIPELNSVAEPGMVEVQDFSNLKGKRVLLAEDDEFNRLLVNKVCIKYGITLSSAPDGESALELLIKDNFDLVLTDVNMPGMDGFELTFRIRHLTDKAKADIPILAVTANVMERELRQIMDSGMNGYILKPFREKELLAKISITCNTLNNSN